MARACGRSSSQRNRGALQSARNVSAKVERVGAKGRTKSAEACDHFVENKENPVLVADRTQPLQIAETPPEPITDSSRTAAMVKGSWICWSFVSSSASCAPRRDGDRLGIARLALHPHCPRVPQAKTNLSIPGSVPSTNGGRRYVGGTSRVPAVPVPTLVG